MARHWHDAQHFEKAAHDRYATPYKAAQILDRHLEPGSRFVEPCAGGGDLIEHLKRLGHWCDEKYDLVTGTDARVAQYGGEAGPPLIITNPPWSRPVMHAIIDNCRVQAPTWFLIDSDWANTLQAGPYLDYCRKIVACGRLLWFERRPDGGVRKRGTGQKSSSWYLFQSEPCETVFYPNVVVGDE